MNGENFPEQINAYLLGELSPAQAAAFERALAADGALRRLLREHEEDLERMTLEIAPQVDPPDTVREKLLAAAAADRRASVRSVDADTPRSSPSAELAAGWSVLLRRLLAGVAVLALLAVCAGWWQWRESARKESDALRSQVRDLTVENRALHGAQEEAVAVREARGRLEREVAAVREQAEGNARDAAALRAQLVQTQQDLLAARDRDVFTRLQVGSLQPPPGALPTVPAVPAVDGIAMWDPQRQQGLLVVENLPVPRPDQDYQVWVADPARPQPVPSGVFHPARAGGRESLRFVTNERIERAVQFMVTLERKGGVNRITGAAVLESQRTR